MSSPAGYLGYPSSFVFFVSVVGLVDCFGFSTFFIEVKISLGKNNHNNTKVNVFAMNPVTEF
jgi:hypothetical protein